MGALNARPQATKSATAARPTVVPTASERIRWKRPWPAVLGALSVPIVIVAMLVAWWTAFFPPAVWFLVLGIAYRAAGHGTPWRRAQATTPTT